MVEQNHRRLTLRQYIGLLNPLNIFETFRREPGVKVGDGRRLISVGEAGVKLDPRREVARLQKLQQSLFAIRTVILGGGYAEIQPNDEYVAVKHELDWLQQGK